MQTQNMANFKYYVELDGDKYMMTFPFQTQMEEIEQLVWDKKLPGVRRSTILDTCLAIKVIKDGKRTTYKTVAFSEAVTLPANYKPCKWRPMLIPVKNKQLEFSNWFHGTKNGTILTGYSLYIGKNGGIVRPAPKRPAAEPESRSDCYEYTYGMEFRLGDTDPNPENQLKWLVWNGTLICTTTLIRGIPSNIIAP